MRSDTPRSFALTVGSQWESCLPTCTVQHPPVLTRPQGSWSHAVTSWYLLSVSMVSKRLFSQYQLGGSKTKQCVMWAPTDRVSLSPRWMAWRYRHEMHDLISLCRSHTCMGEAILHPLTYGWCSARMHFQLNLLVLNLTKYSSCLNWTTTAGTGNWGVSIM